MLLTVTLNPSVDIAYHLNSFAMDEVNRVKQVHKTAGGKGLNVTRVAKLLGLEALATGIIGGTVGSYISQQLETDQIKHDFYQIDQESRNCIAILHEGKQTEILESGPDLTEQEGHKYLEKFGDILTKYSIKVLTISGSLPNGLSPELYKSMIKIANERNIAVVLDTSGDTLKTVLDDPSLRIAAIKPNEEELSAIEEHPLSDNLEDWKQWLQSSRYASCEWVIVSMGSKGAFAKYKEEFYYAKIPSIRVVSPVGSGDATVAGIAKSLEEQLAPEELLKTAMTAGILNAMENQTGFINIENYKKYFDQIRVIKC